MNEEKKTPLCPFCQSAGEDTGREVFCEIGEYLNDDEGYEAECFLTQLKCKSCRTLFYIENPNVF